MAQLDENFYRCKKCGGCYFHRQDDLVLQIDPELIVPERYRELECRELRRLVRYVCSSCGEVLDRAAIVKERQDAERAAREASMKSRSIILGGIDDVGKD